MVLLSVAVHVAIIKMVLLGKKIWIKSLPMVYKQWIMTLFYFLYQEALIYKLKW